MIWILIAIICGSVALDQLTKWIAVLYLQPVDSIPLWEGVLHLTYVENPGAAWGMLANHRWVFMLFSTIAIIGLGIYLFGFSKEPTWVKVSLALVMKFVMVFTIGFSSSSFQPLLPAIFMASCSI